MGAPRSRSNELSVPARRRLCCAFPATSQRCLGHPCEPVTVDRSAWSSTTGPSRDPATTRHADVMMQQPPGPIGLYDPRNEHDSCGVSFVANLRGVRSNELVRHRAEGAHQPGAPRRHRRRGRHRRRRRHPDPGARRLPPRGRRLRASGRGCLRRRHRLPAGRRRSRARRPMAAIEAIVADEGLAGARLARRADRPRLPRRDGPCGDADVPAAVRRRPRRSDRHRPRPQGVRRPQADPSTSWTANSRPTSRRCRLAPSSTRACSPRRS